MNKKGMTIIEIVISIGLISLVMLFLFNLLTDMQFEEKHPSFAKENQLNRAMIIKTVEEDFLKQTLKDVTITGTGTSRNINFSFAVAPINKTLTVYEKSITYDGERWLLTGEDEGLKYDVEHITKSSSTSGRYRYIKIVIPVITSEDANIIDDIEFFFIGTI